MIVKLLGGPDDGREVDLPGGMEPPPQINVAVLPEGVVAEHLDDPANPIGPPIRAHVYMRQQRTLGPLSQITYRYEGTQ